MNESKRRFNMLLAWRQTKLDAAKLRDEPFFMGKPDQWFADGPLFGCANGHASDYILKSEVRGDLCLACHENVILIPPEYTDETLTKELEEYAKTFSAT